MISDDQVLALYDRHARELTGFFARRTGDAHLAVDLVSETFLVVLERRGQCRAEDDAGRAAWLFRIATTNLAGYFRHSASERRTRQRLESLQRVLSAGEMAAVEDLAERAESRPLARAYGELSEDQRVAIEMRVIEEQPYDVVSRGLGISEPAARARVSRGIRALRRAAGRERSVVGDQ